MSQRARAFVLFIEILRLRRQQRLHTEATKDPPALIVEESQEATGKERYEETPAINLRATLELASCGARWADSRG